METTNKRKKKLNTTLYIAPSRENFLERYCDRYKEQIVHCYQTEWDRFVEVCNLFLDGRFTNDLKVLFIDHLESVPKDLKTRFTEFEKGEYSQYLFQASVCMDGKYRKVGTVLECDLPVAFKIYLKKERYERLAKQGLPIDYCVKDFNSLRECCINSIKAKLKKFDFNIKPIDEGVVNKFEFFTLGLIQKRKYNVSEDLLIKGKRDRHMSIITNYKPNKFFFLKKKSIFAVEDDRSQEVAVFATMGLLTLAAIGISILDRYNKNKTYIEQIKESAKYFTSEEVDKIDHFLNLLCKDIDILEEFYIKNTSIKKFGDYLHIYIDDNLRDVSMNQHKIDMKKNKIMDDNCLTIQLKFKYKIDNEAYELDDGTFVSGSSDSLTKLQEKVEEFTNTKLKNYKLDRSKSKIIEIYNGDIGSDYYEKILKIEPPKEIVDIIKSVRERLPKE